MPELARREAGGRDALQERQGELLNLLRPPRFGRSHARLLVLIGVAAVALALFLTWSGRPQEVSLGAVQPARADPGQAVTSAEVTAGASSAAAVEAPTASATSGPDLGPSSADQASSAEPGVMVHVTGMVRSPGVVQLPAGSRVVDAVEAAGGARARGNVDAVNLARVLADGERVDVPRVGQAAAGPAVEAATSEQGPVSLNHAPGSSLEELPGVGPVLAGRIVAWRETNGPFTAVDDLEQVSGIGPTVMEQVRPLVTL